MNKICAVSVLFAMLISLFAGTFSIAAEEADTLEAITHENEAQALVDVLSFSCVYDSDSKNVTVRGTMNHDVFASHKDSSLLVFLVPPGASEYDVATADDAKPLAQAAASVNFGFTFKASGFVDRYSRYAIFLRSNSGELTLGTRAQYAEVASSSSVDSEKLYFKGISSSIASIPSQIDAGSVIIDVYPNSLITSKSNGYIYQTENNKIFFDKSTVDGLDSRINSASASGAKVYLRILFENNGVFWTDISETVSYVAPNMYDDETLLLIHSVTEFLVKRYDGNTAGKISGIVTGRAWDNYGKYNFCPNLTFGKYVELCGFYATVVSNAARSIEPQMDVILPFSGDNFKVSSVEEKEECYETDALIQALLKYFDDSFVSGFECNFLIETAAVPFGISNESIEQGINISDEISSGFCAGTQGEFSQYLAQMAEEYESAPTSYIFYWVSPSSLNGNALSAAYAYSYYTLFGDSKVSAFVCDFSNSADNEENVFDIVNLMKKIDTASSFSVTKSLLAYFGRSTWTEVTGISDVVNNSRLIYTVSPKFSISKDCKGSFLYFDFSESLFTDGWYKGVGTNLIKIDYAEAENKALRAEMTLSANEYSELIYDYEYHENMSYTKYIKFVLQVNDEYEDSLYEVKLLLENSQSRFETSCVVNSNEKNEIVMDFSELTSFGTVENIKISIRSLDGKAQACTLWLYELSGHSVQYSTEELEELIFNERSKIKSVSDDVETSTSFETIIFAIGVIAVVTAIGVGIFIALKRDHNNGEE